LVQEQLAIRIGEATVDRIAAHHGNDVRILLRFVFPQDLAVMVEIEREHRVRERRVDVHRIPDYQWRTLMPAQHPGRERPSDLHLADVVGVDLVKLGIALVIVSDGWHHDVRRVRLHLHEVAVLRIGSAEHEWR
jgi:hypothetical protein